ncbi:MAG: hypothetical protein C0497_04220 [Gemmatimonas sp.]|nr:hypothetical protein [Gemmatimonas sp.]
MKFLGTIPVQALTTLVARLQAIPPRDWTRAGRTIVELVVAAGLLVYLRVAWLVFHDVYRVVRTDWPMLGTVAVGLLIALTIVAFGRFMDLFGEIENLEPDQWFPDSRSFSTSIRSLIVSAILLHAIDVVASDSSLWLGGFALSLLREMVRLTHLIGLSIAA